MHLEGRTVDAVVVEIYVPLMSNKIFTGAFEIYYDITHNNDALNLLLNQLKAIIIAFSLLFFVFIFLILFKASRNILGRDIEEAALHAAHAELEKKVAERTTNLEKINQSLLIEIERRRDSDLALRESDRRLRAILKANPDPMVMYDLKGHPQYINPAFTTVFGWSLNEVEGRVIPFVPEDQKELSAKKTKELYRYGKISSFETRRLTKGNNSLDILLSAVITTGIDGTPDGMVVNLRNISKKEARISIK